MATENFLEELYSSVLNVPTIEAFKDEFTKFGRKLGFDLVSASYGTPPPKRAWISVNNYPKEWQAQQAQFAGVDPIVAAVTTLPRPVLWNADLYKKTGLGHVAEIFTPFGFTAGFDIPMHAANGAILVLAFSRNSELPNETAELVRLVSEAQLLGTFAFPALDRLHAHTRQNDFPKLTPKELEVLKWTIAGKTAFEVGAILGSTERTANFHVRNICEKLGVFNKRSAIVKALELKLVV